MEFFNHLFFDFKGRIGRKTYWYGSVAIILLETALCLFLAQFFDIPILDLGNPELTEAQWSAIYDQVGTLGLLANVVFLWPWIAVIGKRCHDRDKSGWWTLLAYVPIIGNIWSLVELGFIRGNKGPNRFGVDPLAKG
jgi:uncharacterized membrane protein YhaH (DUF805 family)